MPKYELKIKEILKELHNQNIIKNINHIQPWILFYCFIVRAIPCFKLKFVVSIESSSSFDLYKRVKSCILSHKSDPTSHNESIRDKRPLFCQPLWKIQNNKESQSLCKISSINSYKLQFWSSWEILLCSLNFISKSCYLWVQDAIWFI